jgi:hemolysin D
VLSISSDAFNAQEQGWLFKTVIALPGSYLESQGRQFRLSPGMSAQVEIKTGKRKIFDYFLSPLQTKIAESLNER